MATSLSYLIMYLGLYSRVISVGVGAYRFSYLCGPVLLFFILETFGLVMVAFSHWVSASNNTYLSFISTAVDAIFMSLIYAPLLPTRLLRGTIWALGPVFVALLTADYWWGEGLRRQGSNYVAGLECLVVSGFLLVYLSGLMGNDKISSLRRHPMFLISACLTND